MNSVRVRIQICAFLQLGRQGCGHSATMAHLDFSDTQPDQSEPEQDELLGCASVQLCLPFSAVLVNASLCPLLLILESVYCHVQKVILAWKQ